jgi:Kdo2-lipid IVA lauroyltransferase/acyltransferase
LMAQVPPLLYEKFAQTLSYLAWDLLRVRRKVVLQNLTKAFPAWDESKKSHTARRSFQSFFQTMFEFAGSGSYFKKAQMDIFHREYLDAALTKRQGAYIICIHMSNWEYMCSVGTREFAKVFVLAKDVGKGASAQWVTQTRAHNGCYVIPRNGETPAAQLIPKVLARNEIIGFIMDQHKPGGPLIPLFTHPAHTNSGLVQLAMRTPAPIIPAVSRRISHSHHELYFLPEFILEKPSGMKFKETVLHNLERLNKVVEEMIRFCPEQYFWLHKRWKVKADEEKRPS